ncbi:EscU/YscU/HrcU family type III secretion system export apparatus switch protein [Breoghania sp.]|uniref:EscU/YscU/HrcU family type III secretion system export apparatus switch protein n=1 Tax=Breoghania sp. TaxID=2065378 RepID=UPI00261D067E|nr:EscU/YscU/HrcU family type III secretion system export apparatus switch protein [Breoghania sp.]MDJ0932219.1 EscU/YscU/HrcU family type III secretion system export apparatus switch protein [Breoghania sp.]
MSDEMKKGDPNWVAVALRDDHVGAQRVTTAKGAGHVADNILKLARESGVPVEEDAILAQALAQLNLDEDIPEELYKAVAVIIGFILRRGGKQPK